MSPEHIIDMTKRPRDFNKLRLLPRSFWPEARAAALPLTIREVTERSARRVNRIGLFLPMIYGVRDATGMSVYQFQERADSDGLINSCFIVAGDQIK